MNSSPLLATSLLFRPRVLSLCTVRLKMQSAHCNRSLKGSVTCYRRDTRDRSVRVCFSSRTTTPSSSDAPASQLQSMNMNAEKPPELRQMEDLPVEAGLPLVGKAMDFVRHDFEFETMFDKHNTNLLRVNCGPIGGWCLMIRDPKDIDEVLVKKSDEGAFILKWPDGPAKMILPLERTIALHESQALRRAITRMVSAESVARLHMPLVGSCFTTMFHRIVEKGETVMLDNLSRRVSYDVAVKAVMGTFLTTEDIEYLFPYAVINQHAAFSLNYGFEEGIPGTLYNQGIKAKNVMVEYVAKRLQTALQEEVTSGEIDDNSIISKFLKCLAEEGYDICKEGCTKTAAEDLAREVVMLNFAATENSSYLLCNATMLMARHPEWLDAIWQEQQELIKEYGEDNYTRQVFSRSNVALACAQEALRLKPPLKVLFRSAAEDTSIGGVAVPKDTTIALAVRQAIRETGNCSRDFEPSQWLTTTAEGRVVCKPNLDQGNFVFGRGNRKCIGQHLAAAELSVCLMTLARQVKEVRMAPEEMHREYFVVGPHPTGLPVKFIARDRPEIEAETADPKKLTPATVGS